MLSQGIKLKQTGEVTGGSTSKMILLKVRRQSDFKAKDAIIIKTGLISQRVRHNRVSTALNIITTTK